MPPTVAAASTTTSGLWTPTSMLLEKSWEGIELFNIRVVTNDSREILEHYEQNLSYPSNFK